MRRVVRQSIEEPIEIAGCLGEVPFVECLAGKFQRLNRPVVSRENDGQFA
jgi:hypothetical protein